MTVNDLLRELKRYEMSVGMFARLAGIGNAAGAVNHWKRIKSGRVPRWVPGWFMLWEHLAPETRKRLIYSVTPARGRRHFDITNKPDYEEQLR